MRHKQATKFVTSDEMTLREFMAQFFYFGMKISIIYVFLIKIILKKVFEYVINRL